MKELPFLHSARRLMLINICMKFREDSFRGFQVTERTRFVTDRQTDGHPDARVKNNMSPNPSGGDIMQLNELSLLRTEFCKSQSRRRQPPISWKICYFSSFCNTGVRINVTARLYILCKYACTIFRN